MENVLTGTEPSQPEISLQSQPLSSEQPSLYPPQQAEMPFAMVAGQVLKEFPKDLYIPPDALEIFLEAFEGPLDLLLYLIKRQNLDILDIPVAEVTHQYMAYVNLMEACQFELAAEYLVMAALLGEIKSRCLLPRQGGIEEDENDPRAELIRRLQEYECFKRAAEELDQLPRLDRDLFLTSVTVVKVESENRHPDVDMQEILIALREVLQRADMYENHHIQKESLSIRERMSQILDQLSGGGFVPFVNMFRIEEGRLGVVVSFIALLELIREALIEIVQSDVFAPIHVKAKA
jgi:segregation and condensation protein A